MVPKGYNFTLINQLYQERLRVHHGQRNNVIDRLAKNFFLKNIYYSDAKQQKRVKLLIVRGVKPN